MVVEREEGKGRDGGGASGGREGGSGRMRLTVQ